jgi:hypothetical protein
MDKHAPFLVEAGIKFDLERIRSGDFSDIARICEDKVFSKGIMLELKKLSGLPIQLLLDLVKFIVPLPLHEVVETMNVNAFKSKILGLCMNLCSLLILFLVPIYVSYILLFTE